MKDILENNERYLIYTWVIHLITWQFSSQLHVDLQIHERDEGGCSFVYEARDEVMRHSLTSRTQAPPSRHTALTLFSYLSVLDKGTAVALITRLPKLWNRQSIINENKVKYSFIRKSFCKHKRTIGRVLIYVLCTLYVASINALVYLWWDIFRKLLIFIKMY